MSGLVALVLAYSFSTPAVISADPDAPICELGWQTSLVAKIGAPLTLIEAGKGPWFVVGLPSFIELRNAPRSPIWVPYEYWRARVQLAGHIVFAFDDAWSFSAGLRLEHESDHATQGATDSTGFVNLNAVAAPLTLRWQYGANATAATLTARVHVVTCTLSPEYCAQGGGTWGDVAFEPALALTYQRVLFVGESLSFDAFGSLFLNVVFPTRLVAEEHHLNAKVGVGLLRPRLGRVYLYVNFWAGTLPGFLRSSGDTVQAGFGFGWTPG